MMSCVSMQLTSRQCVYKYKLVAVPLLISAAHRADHSKELLSFQLGEQHIEVSHVRLADSIVHVIASTLLL